MTSLRRYCGRDSSCRRSKVERRILEKEQNRDVLEIKRGRIYVIIDIEIMEKSMTCLLYHKLCGFFFSVEAKSITHNWINIIPTN